MFEGEYIRKEIDIWCKLGVGELAEPEVYCVYPVCNTIAHQMEKATKINLEKLIPLVSLP